METAASSGHDSIIHVLFPESIIMLPCAAEFLFHTSHFAPRKKLKGSIIRGRGLRKLVILTAASTTFFGEITTFSFFSKNLSICEEYDDYYDLMLLP